MSEQLGRYTLVRKLADGTTGDVFLGKAAGPGGFEKSLVIKRIAPVLVAQGAFVQNFLQEARAAAALDHPNVVQLFDFGEASGRYYLAMEYVEGATSRALAPPGKRMPVPLAARLVSFACEGVAFAHELGLIHGNLCPEHLMVTKTGGVKVLDFGVSRVAVDALGFTPGGRLVYQPAEQVLGDYDLRADVFALGAILYELTSGATPYPEMSDAKLKKAITGFAPIPFAQQAPDLDPAFVAVVEQAMARNPDDRFQSCRELGQALEDWLRAKKERVGTKELAQLVSGIDDVEVDFEDDAPEPVVMGEAPPSAPAPMAALRASAPAPLARPSAPEVVMGQLRPSAPVPFGAVASVSVTSPSAPPIPEPPSPFDAFEPLPAFAAAQAGVAAPSPYAPSAARVSGSIPASAPSPARNTGSTPAFVPSSASVTGSAPAYAPSPARNTGSVPAYAPSPAAAVVSSAARNTGSMPAYAPPSQSAGFFDAAPPAPTPARATAMDPEARSQAVLASAKAMRTFEAGPALGSPAELDPIRQELEREEGPSLLVRFALHAGRLHQANPEFGALITDKLVGVAEGLLLAEAYTPLAQLFERLEAQSRDDVEARWVLETLRGTLVTPTQAFRLAARLKELAPADAAGLGRVIGLFGGEYAPLWIGFYEAMELPGSREAMQPGLSTLAGKNPKAFLARLEVKRPKRVIEFVSFLEKGRGADRQRVFKELMARPEPIRRREVLAGLAQAGTDDALKLCLQAITEPDEELRIHAAQLIAKHFSDKALTLLAPLMDDSYDERSHAERLALWRALGASDQPDVLAAIVEVLKRKPTLMNRGRVEQRKLDALEGLAEMKRPEVSALLEATWNDRSQPDPVRASAQRLLAAVQKLRVDEHVEARRWERTPSTFLDVVLDLHSLSCAARVIDVTSPVLEIGFARLKVRLEALLPQGARATFGVQMRQLTVNGESLSVPEGDDSLARVETAFSRRGVLGFVFHGAPGLDDLHQLVRWLALGPSARTFTTRRIERLTASGAELLPELPKVPMPTVSEPSREAMVRYADLVLGLRAFVQQKKTAPATLPPELRVPLHELAMILHGRSARFLGLSPAVAGHDALLFHTVNALALTLGFAAELGLSRERLVNMAELALYADAGQLELSDETLQGRRAPTREELLAVRKATLRLPLARAGDAPSGTRWASVTVEQEKPGIEHSALGGIVALARLWEGLTSTQSPESALEQLQTKAASRVRSDLVPLFVRYLRRQSMRPLKR